MDGDGVDKDGGGWGKVDMDKGGSGEGGWGGIKWDGDKCRRRQGWKEMGVTRKEGGIGIKVIGWIEEARGIEKAKWTKEVGEIEEVREIKEAKEVER